MKIARPSTLIAVALMAFSLSVVGCRKDLQKPTTLMGRGPGKGLTGDERGSMIGTGQPVNPGGGNFATDSSTPVRPNVPGANETGIPQAPGDWDNPSKWTPDRDAFKDSTVYFDFDKANVKPSEVEKLKEVARRMKTYHGKALKIEGHCDERGTEEYNRSLGDKRAQSIREFLASEGFDANYMPTTTFGEDKPADPGHNEAAYAKNRRGELVLLSPTGAN
jgi:peptidoglycan-associated lipoprotein